MKKAAMILFYLGVVVFAIDLFYYMDSGKVGNISLAFVIFKIKSSYLPLVQTVVERYISMYLWEYFVYPILSWPLWVVLWGISFILRFISAFRDIKLRNKNNDNISDNSLN